MTQKDYSLYTSQKKFAKRVATFKENHPDLSPEQFEAELEKLRKLFDATDVSSLEEVLEDPTIKIYKVLTSNYESKDSLMEITSYVEQELPNLVVTSSFKTNIEVTHKDAQKRNRSSILRRHFRNFNGQSFLRLVIIQMMFLC